MARSDNMRRPNVIGIGLGGRILAGAVLALTVGAAATATTVAAAASRPAEALVLAVAGIVLLIAGAATDAAARWRSGLCGLVAVPVAALGIVAASVALPAWATSAAACVAAAAAAVAAPALLALLLTGAETRTPATPRMRFVLGVGSPWSAAAHRDSALLVPLSAAVGWLAAGIAAFSPDPGVTALVLTAAVALFLGTAAARLATTAGPDRAAEASARILAPAVGGALGAVIVGAVIVGAVLPSGVAIVVIGAVTVLLAVVPVVAARVQPATGRRLSPGTRAYRSATRGFARSAQPRPDAAYLAASVADVQAAVADAAATGLGVIANSTGHGAASLPDMSGVALVRIRLQEPVTVDTVARTARIPAGTPWGEVVRALAPTGLMAPHGSSAIVGAMGYLLRGGLSFYGRASGVAANSIESIELVTAEGQLRVVSHTHDPQLFWALRGGGGFGVVTAMTVRLFPVTALTTGTVFWPVDKAPELLAAWVGWHPRAPREATTAFRVMRLPRLPGIPRSIVGRAVVSLDGVVHTREHRDADARVAEVTDHLLAPLREICAPLLDTWRAASVLDVPWTHMDPAVALPTLADHLLVNDLDDAGRRAFLDVALRPDSRLATIELRQLGGAFAEPPVGGGALDQLRGAMSLFASGLASPASKSARIEHEFDELRVAMGPWASGFTAPNYAEDRHRPQRSFPDPVSREVDAVRSRIDPSGLFAADISVGALPSDAGGDSAA